MGTTQPRPIDDAEYKKLLTGLRGRELVALVTVDEPRPDGVSNDDAHLMLALGNRYVAWGKRSESVSPNIGELGHFSEVRMVDRKRAAELIAAGATWSGDESDQPE